MKQMVILLAASTFVISTGVWAQNAVNAGYDVLTCEITELPLEEGHSLVVSKGKGVALAAPDKPWHMSQMDCLTTTEIMADKVDSTDRRNTRLVNRS